jgi:hypothetical protein
MLQRGILLWVTMMVMACAPRAVGPVAPKPSRGALEAEPVDWAKHGALAIPESAKHIQLIITGGFKRDEHFAWLIVNGTEVVGVFRASPNEVDDVLGTAAGAARAAVSSPIDTASFAAIGIIYTPPPPPPPHGKPPFFPQIYVENVLRLAWKVNQSAQSEGIDLPRAVQ